MKISDKNAIHVIFDLIGKHDRSQRYNLISQYFFLYAVANLIMGGTYIERSLPIFSGFFFLPFITSNHEILIFVLATRAGKGKRMKGGQAAWKIEDIHRNSKVFLPMNLTNK